MRILLVSLMICVFVSVPATLNASDSVYLSNIHVLNGDGLTIYGDGWTFFGLPTTAGVFRWNTSNAQGLGKLVPEWGFCIEIAQFASSGQLK